jgi:hypothetical protein
MNGILIYEILEIGDGSCISSCLLANLLERFVHLIKIMLYALFFHYFSFAKTPYFLIDAFYDFKLLLFLVFYFFPFINKILLFLFMFPFSKFLFHNRCVFKLKNEEFLFL